MKRKVLEKAYAVALRKQGQSYNEIIRRVPVAKSTLSAWLRDAQLSETERQVLKNRVSANISEGLAKAAVAHRENREKRESEFLRESREEFARHKDERLFSVGIALYWAGGTKGSAIFAFPSSDPDMLNIMLDWIERYLALGRPQVKARLYSHKGSADEGWKEYWAEKLNIPLSRFGKTVARQGGAMVKKRPNYKGYVRIELAKARPLKKMEHFKELLIEDYRKSSRVH